MATPRISRMGVSRWGGPSRRTRGIPPALFSMATRPIRQPPATKTDLPCVPRLIFLLSAFACLFPPRPPPPCPPPRPSSSTTSFTIALQPFFVSPLLLSRSFFPSLVCTYTFTRMYMTHTYRRGKGAKGRKRRSRETADPFFLLLFYFFSSHSAIYFLLSLRTLSSAASYEVYMRVYMLLVAHTVKNEVVMDAKQRREKREVPSILPTTDTTPSARLIRTWRL